MSAAVLALPGAQTSPVVQVRKRGPFPGVVKLDEMRERQEYCAQQMKGMEGVREALLKTLAKLDADINSLRAQTAH